MDWKAKDALRRAWADTWAHLGFSWRLATAVQSIIVPAAFVVLIAYFRGKSAAVIEMADIILYSVALFGTAFLPVLLWILWLLPYKSLEEQPDLLGKQLHSRLEAVPPEKADVWDYAKHTNFLLYEAACLWVGSEPHSPITDKKRGPNVAN